MVGPSIFLDRRTHYHEHELPNYTPSPSVETRAATAAAIRDVWHLFEDEVPSPVRPFYAPTQQSANAAAASRTRKSNDVGQSNKVDRSPSPQKEKRLHIATSGVAAGAPSAAIDRLPSLERCHALSVPTRVCVSLSPELSILVDGSDSHDPPVPSNPPVPAGPPVDVWNVRCQKRQSPRLTNRRRGVIGKQFMTYLRTSTFDAEKFSKDHPNIYFTGDMDIHDTKFQNQAF